MDSRIIEIFLSMDSLFRYVESVGKLKVKEQRYMDLIKESLRTIEDCASLVLEYVNGSARGTNSLRN